MLFDAQAYELEDVRSEDGWGKSVRYSEMRPVPFNYSQRHRQYVSADAYRDLLLKYEALKKGKA